MFRAATGQRFRHIGCSGLFALPSNISYFRANFFGKSAEFFQEL
jgi:hypothetical protein